MNLTRKTLGALLIGAGMLVAAPQMLETPAFAADGEIDAKSKAVLDRAIEAQFGGKKNIKSMKRAEKVTIASQGITMDVEMIIADGRMASTTTIPGLGEMKTGYDGNVGWSFNQMMGPSVMEGAELSQSKRQSDIYADLHWDRYYTSVSYAGEEDVETFEGDTVKADVLEFAPNHGGAAERRFYSQDTGLLVKSTGEIAGQGGAMFPMTVTVGDYRKIDGIMVAFQSKVRAGPNEIESSVQSVEYNINVPAGTFALPAEVADLAGS